MRVVVCMVVALGCLGLAEERENRALCSSGYHQCYSSSTCIPNNQVCDGKNDCYYGDDEDNCERSTTFLSTETTTRGNSCPEGQYECLTGLCIPDTWVCDGTTDCPSYADDEQDCFRIDKISDSGNETYCLDDEYQCTYSGECIPESWLCDDWVDCPYADDEQHCTSSNTTTLPPQGECESSFDYVYDRCVLVDPFTSTTWDEARYLCEKFSSDLVVLDDYNFYAELLQYIRNKGLDSHNYWVGATDKGVEGVWLWVDSSPVPSGAPLWALYGCTGDYQLEPRPSDAYTQDCGFLDMGRGLHLSDASCDESFASICQTTSGKM